jgi:hypothetical protein
MAIAVSRTIQDQATGRPICNAMCLRSFILFLTINQTASERHFNGKL